MPEEIPVVLKARTFRYERSTHTLYASGDIVVTYRDVTISADRLRVNLLTNVVHAEGHVTIEVGGRRIRAAILEYDLSSRRGRIEQAAADYTGPLVRGTVRIRAAILEGILGGPGVGQDAFCTTCEGPEPVAYLTARELRLYPNDKIVGRSVSVWIGGQRVLTWPYFVIFLRERRASRLLPVLGYSETEGTFLKTFYSYALNSDHYGYLRLDLMERLGIGYGVEHRYRLATGDGTAFLYRLHNRQTGATDLRVTLDHRQRVGDVAAQLFVDHTRLSWPQFASSQVFASLDAHARSAVSTTSVYQAYSSQDFADFGFQTYNARLIHSQQITPTLWIEAAGDFSRVAGFLGTDDELWPRLTLRYRGVGYSIALLAEGRVDVDGDRFSGDLRFFTERLPELTLDMDPQLVPGTRLLYQVQGSVGRFRETQFIGSLEAFRMDVSLTLNGPLIESQRGHLQVYGQMRGSSYSTGDARALAAGRMEYTRYLGDYWIAQVGVTYQDQVGQTPFSFDSSFGRLVQADATMSYRQPNLLASASAFFDAVTSRWAPLEARWLYAPRPEWLVASALSYDPTTGSFVRAELSLDIKLTPRWHVVYYGFYDGLAGRIFHDRLTITRVWQDCFATAVTYRGISNELWFEAWLTALPWARGRVGVGSQGNLLFEQPWFSSRP